MINKGTLIKKLIDNQSVWCVKYFNKNTGNDNAVKLYPKDIPYLEIENLQENSEIKISVRYYSEKTKFLFPADTIIAPRFIDSGQYYSVAKIIFTEPKIKYETLSSKITGIDDEERLQWEDFYLSLVCNLPVGYAILTDTAKTYLETNYKPPIKK